MAETGTPLPGGGVLLSGLRALQTASPELDASGRLVGGAGPADTPRQDGCFEQGWDARLGGVRVGKSPCGEGLRYVHHVTAPKTKITRYVGGEK